MNRVRKNNHKYQDYDYENEYDTPLIMASEKEIEEALNSGKIKSVYTTKTIKAGNQFEVEIYPSFTRKEIKDKDIKKVNQKQMKNLNDRNARKYLERLLNENFKKYDLWLTFTYDKEHLPKNIDEAIRNMKNFIRRINYKRQKEGLPKAKYIYITEGTNSKKNGIRFHHHLVMDSELDGKVVKRMWKHGEWTTEKDLAPKEDGFKGLAYYLSKDPQEESWCASTNLKKPKIRRSYTGFRASQVKKMVKNRAIIEKMLEKKYKKYSYLSEDIRFNQVNGRFYIYVRMREREVATNEKKRN